MKIVHLHQLLHVVGNIRAEVIAARAQFARGQFLVSDIIEQQRLHRIHIAAATPIKLVLDDVEQATMQSLDQCQSFDIDRLYVARSSGSRWSNLCLENAVHDPSLLNEPPRMPRLNVE